MSFRYSPKILLGLLAIGLSAPGIASAQSLFGAPAGETNTAPPEATLAPPEPAAPKKAVKAKSQKPAVAKQASRVNVFNERKATLVELSLTPATVKDAKPQVVAHGLASGKKISAALAKKGGCIYSVSGTFDDKSTVEMSALDLCKDNHLNLVE